jgi:cellulose synthase/poly-beta-1,6-N-acetylglucosamine synthase-like glycosyltransferase
MLFLAAIAAGPWLYHHCSAWRAHYLVANGAAAAGPLRDATFECFAYLAIIYVTDFALVIIAALENGKQIRQARVESYDTIVDSRFTIPVSVIAPMHNEEVLARAVVDALLSLEYPEYEVIIVNDGSTDGTLELLRRTYSLEPYERFERRTLPTDDVLGVYRSTTDPRLTVIDKVAGGNKAYALNCGLNFARYRYVCCVDGDTVYERDALLRSMRLVLHDPSRVIGVTSQIVVATQPERSYAESGGMIGSTFLHNFQHLEYLRAFLNDRLAWSRMGFMLCTSGAFMLYRRDVIEEVGGYSPDFSCEDIELTFRVHEQFLREGRPYKIVAMPEPVGRTEGPNRLGSLISQRARWQRVMLETTWSYRRMFLNPRYGRFGLIGMPFLVLSEVAAPFLELLGVSILGAAALVGAVSWTEYGLIIGLMSFGNAGLTVAAIGLEDAGTRSYRLRDLVWLILLSPFELVLYRPPLFWAHARGAFGFFRGDKRWERFDRNPRAAGGLADQPVAPTLAG